jgi:outer membrane protein assembly factor BamB
LLPGQPGLFAFDTENGEPKWDFVMPSLESGPAVSGQHVYAGSTLDGTIYAVDLTSGDEIWRASIGEDLPLNSSPAVAGGNIFITTAFDGIICIDAGSGAERWRASAEHISLNSSAIVVDNSLYVVDTNFGVSAFATADGSLLWSEELTLTGQVVDSPIVSNGNLFIVTSLEGESGHIAKLWVFTGTIGAEPDAGESS